MTTDQDTLTIADADADAVTAVGVTHVERHRAPLDFCVRSLCLLVKPRELPGLSMKYVLSNRGPT